LFLGGEVLQIDNPHRRWRRRLPLGPARADLPSESRRRIGCARRAGGSTRRKAPRCRADRQAKWTCSSQSGDSGSNSA
jgi:hypothetical protein